MFSDRQVLGYKEPECHINFLESTNNYFSFIITIFLSGPGTFRAGNLASKALASIIYKLPWHHLT